MKILLRRLVYIYEKLITRKEKRIRFSVCYRFPSRVFLEELVRFELTIGVLQTPALPLGYSSTSLLIFFRSAFLKIWKTITPNRTIKITEIIAIVGKSDESSGEVGGFVYFERIF